MKTEKQINEEKKKEIKAEILKELNDNYLEKSTISNLERLDEFLFIMSKIGLIIFVICFTVLVVLMLVDLVTPFEIFGGKLKK